MADPEVKSLPEAEPKGFSHGDGETLRKCIACKEPIPEGANLCKVCKSDQAEWRNELKFWAGVAGIFTLVASGLAFTANLGFELWQRAFGHEIAVTNIDPFGKTVAWNLSRNPIYLKTISVQSTAPRNDLVWEVHKTIPANSSIELELLEVAKASWYGLPGEKFGKAPAEYAKVDQSVFEQLKRSELTDKYVPTFLMPDSESYTQLKRNLGEHFSTFECAISIGFVRLWDGSSSSIAVPCSGAFRFRASTSKPKSTR
jgi:hypothetical protein